MLDTSARATLWRREREDPVPVILFYLLSPPQQPVVVYDEIKARELFETINAPAVAER